MAKFEEALKFSLSQPPVYFAGRLGELARLKSLITSGDARTAVIVGRRGIGKSALVGAFVAQTSGFLLVASTDYRQCRPNY